MLAEIRCLPTAGRSKLNTHSSGSSCEEMVLRHALLSTGSHDERGVAKL